MLRRFIEQTRVPQSLVNDALDGMVAGVGTKPEDQFLDQWHNRNGSRPDRIQDLTANTTPGNLDSIVDTLRFERYLGKSHQEIGQPGASSIVRKTYYALRPLFPVGFRKYLQRIALKGWDKKNFPAWPVDFTIEDLFDQTFQFILKALDLPEIPFIWYWPEGHSGCCIMTHDVETKTGRDFCPEIIKMESARGLYSSFELVPEQRYAVPDDFINQINHAGCEVCVHGLNHDGNLFVSKDIFLERAPQINQYAAKWGATGFRSPVMYRNLDWFDAFTFSYDMSVPNVGHLDPQSGGCCTVMPFFVGDILELPLTTTQDYPLYHILRQRSLALWKEQTAKILARHGLISFIIHPDYTTSDWATRLYESLLDHLVTLRGEHGVWVALPREVDRWWRERSRMTLVCDGGEWRIEGVGAERARIAYASYTNGELTFRIPGNQLAECATPASV